LVYCERSWNALLTLLVTPNVRRMESVRSQAFWN
jgi:hypothetical protein